MSTDDLDLTRTRASLAAFDAAGENLEDINTAADLAAALKARDDAQTAIGDAFAEDTADRNDADIARRVPMCIAGILYIRQLCSGEIDVLITSTTNPKIGS